MSATCASQNGDEPVTLSTFVSSSSTISQGGFDYELLGGVDSRYECPICLLYMRDPVITDCGHRFCLSCISQWVLNQSNPNGCPVDGKNLSHENIFPDNFTRREILACKAKCPYLKEGCSVIMALAEMDQHVESKHIFTPNGSPESTKLNSSANILNGVVECKFKEVGCDHVLPHDQLQRHLDSNVHHHLQLVAASYKRLKRFVCQQGMDFGGPPEFFRQDSRDSTRWLLQEDMDDSEYNFRRQRSWDSVRFARRFNTSRSRLHDRLAESDESIPKHSSSTCSEKDATSNSCQNLTPASGSSKGSSIQLKDLFERLVRLEQNDREKQIKIERLESQLSSALDLCSNITCLMDDMTARYCHGTFIWRISEFGKHCTEMRHNLSRVLTSPGFYTDTFGYKLCMRFNLAPKAGTNANARPVDTPIPIEETTVALYVHFLQGEFDSCISWPFKGEMKLILVHPTKQEESVTESVRSKPEAIALARPKLPRNPTGLGYPDVCSLKKILDGGFIQNDSITFKILAKAS